ncbi:MAG: type II toxin-antitoxin system CcdA family antitoxin [Rhizobiales bacterium]|nr:type II toxin-antitoxin system CcdA family antitoxin [Hyphomicrobiales bacterium]
MDDIAKKPRSGTAASQAETAGDRLAALWQEENRAALKAHAEFIEEHGTLAERLKAFG